ncbi:unnamed protein product, partial [Oppiella nova]
CFWFIYIENKLQDHDTNEDLVSLNSYALESMPLDIILLMEKTMAVLEFDTSGKVLEKCQLFDLEKEAHKADLTASATGLPVIKSDFKTMQEAINKCRELSEKSSPVSSLEQISPNITENSISLFSLWRGLIPGTKLLMITAPLGSRSHCDCDEDFLKCLKRSSNSYAQMLGNFYFNVLKVQCIKEERPVVCVEIRKNSNGKEECVRYEVSNESKMKFVTPVDVMSIMFS